VAILQYNSVGGDAIKQALPRAGGWRTLLHNWCGIYRLQLPKGSQSSGTILFIITVELSRAKLKRIYIKNLKNK